MKDNTKIMDARIKHWEEAQMKNDKTLTDIRIMSRCIEHWQKLKESPMTERIGSSDCAACEEYFSYSCNGCPIANYSGKSCCNNTPYWHAHKIYSLLCDDSNHEGLQKVWKEFAQDEIDFLHKVMVNLEVQ